MAVARSDEGPSGVAGNLTRRRLIRKPAEVPAGGGGPAPAPAPTAAPPPAANHNPPPPAPSSAPPGTRLEDLYRLPMPKLFSYAEREGMSEHTGMNRGQLIMGIVRRQIERGMTVRGSGTLEVLPDGYGFLRSVAHNYLASPEDIYVSPSQIRRLGLRTGLIVEGPIRLPVEGQDNFALMQVDQVNGASPEHRVSPTTFEDLSRRHGISRERVRQIEVRAFKKLQKSMRSATVDDCTATGRA